MKFNLSFLSILHQKGFGKRRSQTNARGEFDPLFISWIPKNIDRKTFVDDVKVTSYAGDYNHESTPPRVLSEVQSMNNDNGNKSTSSPSSTSIYSSVYKHGQPDQERSKQIRRETFQRFLSARTHLSQQQQQQGNGRGATVASCLVWNHTNDDNKSPISNDKITDIIKPITLQPRVVTDNNNNIKSGQRAQSAGPRLISTVSNQQPPPLPEKSVQSQSMQILEQQ